MKKVVVTSFDENYIAYSMVAIRSLGEHYHEPNKLKVVCLVPENMLEQQDEYSKSINQPNLDIEFRTSSKFKQLFNAGKAKAARHSSSNAYQRIFLGSALPEYDVAIYIDPDTLIRRDFKAILNYSKRAPFLAVVETVNMSISVFASHDVPYFNNGVFIADLNFWRSEQIEEKLLSWMSKNENTPLAEQDAMNAILGEHLGPLPFTFNFFDWTVDNNKLMAEDFNDPLIVHFAGEWKPWSNSSNSKYAKEWQTGFRQLQKSLGIHNNID